MDERITRLDDRTVLRLLGAVTENLREEIASGELKSIASADDARAALAALVESEDGRKIEASAIAFDGPAAARSARELLNTMLDDPDTRSVVESELVTPPADAQKSPELALAGAVILGGLITWIQTSIDISINRHKDGTVDYSFRLRKKSSGEGTIRQVANAVTSLIGL